MAGEAGVLFCEAGEATVAAVVHGIAQLVVERGVPGFAGIRHQAFLEPGREVEHDGVLYHFLDVGPEEHSVQIDGGNTFPDLPPQLGVVAIVIYEYGVAHDFSLPRHAGEGFLRADVTLFEIGHIGIDDNLDFLVDAVFQQSLDFREVVLG